MKSIATSIATSSLSATKEKNNPCCAVVGTILFLLLSLPRPAAAQAGTFSPTGSASYARTVHTATLLPNGKVLVAGGFSPPSPTWATAEVYDPNTGLFSSTGGLITARRAHTATRLPNGKVLVAGGRLPPAYFASAELYDPGAGLFSSTGSMATPRAFFTATLLANGKVLVAGGLNAGVYLASAELYDPNTGLFTPTGSLNTAREAHTATLLPDGRVLIAGGDIGAAAFASAEVYDPDTGKFTTTGSMGTARTYHTATLLPASTERPHGKVLIAGGDGTSPGGPSTAFATAELYDPDTGTFSATGSMNAGRWNHTATLLPAYELRPHGKVLVAGGDSGAFSSGILASAELYDPDTGKFSSTGSLNTARHQQTATLLSNGAVLFAEGDNAARTLASAELYLLPPTYAITDLGTLGGTSSQPLIMRNNGLIGGMASRADGIQHAALWYNGQIADIGAPGLGGANSNLFGLNEIGQAVGQAESSVSDPKSEDFCGYGTGLKCLPFLWQYGVMTPLATLGGTNGAASSINNRGQVAGYAQSTAKDPDPACPVSQFKPVVWENGAIRQLPTFPGDPEGMAAWINNNGQVVGASGTCAPYDPNAGLYLMENHALLWQNDGTMIDLGNLGTQGIAGNHACAINNQGQVVGHTNSDTSTRAFLWTDKAGMQNLGTLSGDFASFALGINDKGEVVGVSLDATFNPRAFLWENGMMSDLNALVPAHSPLFLIQAESINASGQIVGFGVTAAGDVHGFLATPTSGEDVSGSLSVASKGVTSPRDLPEDVRKLILQRLRSSRSRGRALVMAPQ